MKTKTVLAIVAVVFALIAVLHLLRVILGWQAVIGSTEIPVWASWVALLVAGFLSYSAMAAHD